MLFSHISDTHLGLTQYGLEERENDIYDAFNQAVDVSIKDHVNFVIFAGDIFHVPNPSGRAILQMANALRRLKENNIDSFFILGEHDISRIRSIPIPYVYHNLKFSRYIGDGKPFIYEDVFLAGFDKIRKSETGNFAEKFSALDSVAHEHKGHRILVMHQGIAEVNQFASELSSADLPRNFTYYAMGHLHDKALKRFSCLSGLIAYPGSTEMTTSEGIKDTEKGFYIVDISAQESNPSWIKLDTRPQLSVNTEFENIENVIDKTLEKIKNYAKKPVIELKISGEQIKTESVQAHLARLAPHSLYYTWKSIHKESADSSVLIDRPANIDDEIFRLATNYLGSERLARFAIHELLPLLAANKISESNHLIVENYEQFKRGMI